MPALYERLARYCDEQISKAILGQTLTSDSGGGSYAQSKTHNDVRHDLTVADCKALASTLRRDLIRPLCIFNFGEDKRIPYIRFDCEESEDLTQTATILGTLIEKVGLRIPTSFVYKKFSIPEPEEGDEIAKPTYGGGMGGVLPWKVTSPRARLKFLPKKSSCPFTMRIAPPKTSTSVRCTSGSPGWPIAWIWPAAITTSRSAASARLSSCSTATTVARPPPRGSRSASSGSRCPRRLRRKPPSP